MIFGDFKLAVKDFNLTVLSFRQVFFANLNGTTAAGQRRAENAHNFFTKLFSENGTDFRLLVSYIVKGYEKGPRGRANGTACGLCLADCIFQFLSGLESNGAGSGHSHFLACPGIANGAGGPLLDFKGTEAGNFNRFALRQRVSDRFQSGIDGFSTLLSGQVGEFGNGVDQFSFIHYPYLFSLMYLPPVVPITHRKHFIAPRRGLYMDNFTIYSPKSLYIDHFI